MNSEQTQKPEAEKESAEILWDNLSFLLQCIAFQNSHGRVNWEMNKKGIYGNEESQAFARNRSFEEWLLRSATHELENIKSSNLTYGKSGSHVWVLDNATGERVFMIFVSRTGKLCIEPENPHLFEGVLERQFGN